MTQGAESYKEAEKVFLTVILAASAINADVQENALYECMAQASKFMAMAQETAPVVVDAALGVCRKEELEYRNAIMFKTITDLDANYKLYQFRLDFVKRAVLADVVMSRVKPSANTAKNGQ